MDLRPDIEKTKTILSEMKKEIDKFNELIKSIITKLNSLIKSMNTFYDIKLYNE